MNRLVLPLILAIFFPYLSGAQVFLFTDSTNSWDVLEASIAQPYPPATLTYYHNYWGIDTVINSRPYKEFLGGSALSYNVYVSEDTVAGKLYVYTNFDTAFREALLMDYSLQVGDTFKHVFAYDSMAYVVASIDSTMVGNNWHRVWHMDPLLGYDPINSYAFIEGIGSSNGPLFPIKAATFEAYWLLYCFSHNNAQPPVSPAVGGYNFDNTSSCHLDVKRIVENTRWPVVVPNPADGNARIAFNTRINSGKIVITDAIGRVMKKDVVSGLQYYLIGDLPAPGIYFYVLVEGNSGKLMRGSFFYE